MQQQLTKKPFRNIIYCTLTFALFLTSSFVSYFSILRGGPAIGIEAIGRSLIILATVLICQLHSSRILVAFFPIALGLLFIALLPCVDVIVPTTTASKFALEYDIWLAMLIVMIGYFISWKMKK